MQAVAVVIVVVAERRNIGETTQLVVGCSRFKISVQTTPCLSPRRPGTDRILGATNRCKQPPAEPTGIPEYVLGRCLMSPVHLAPVAFIVVC